MGPGGVPKKATLAGGIGIAVVAIVAYALLGCGEKHGVAVPRTNTPEATATATITPGPTATYTPAPTATPSVYIPGPEGFVCPTKWTPYQCPIISPDVPGLIAPFPAGADVEIMCKYVDLVRRGLEDNTYMLIKVPPNTPVLALAGGAIATLDNSTITPNAKRIVWWSRWSPDPNLPLYGITIFFVGSASVSMGDSITRGQELGISFGLPPFPADPAGGDESYKLGQDLEGASIIIAIAGQYEEKYLDASRPDLWAGNALSCLPSQ